MSDPAVEAAQRAARSIYPNESMVSPLSVLAAQEALYPIRELHYKVSAHGVGWVCASDGRRWPCVTARRIYSESELPQ